MGRWRWALTLTFVVLASAAKPTVSFISRSYVLSAPATLRFGVRVEPDEDFRWVNVELDGGDDFYRSSEAQLNGLNGPVVTWIEWTGIPAGDYMLVARVATSSGAVAATASRPILVSGF